MQKKPEKLGAMNLIDCFPSQEREFPFAESFIETRNTSANEMKKKKIDTVGVCVCFLVFYEFSFILYIMDNHFIYLHFLMHLKKIELYYFWYVLSLLFIVMRQLVFPNTFFLV